MQMQLHKHIKLAINAQFQLKKNISKKKITKLSTKKDILIINIFNAYVK